MRRTTAAGTSASPATPVIPAGSPFGAANRSATTAPLRPRAPLWMWPFVTGASPDQRAV